MSSAKMSGSESIFRYENFLIFFPLVFAPLALASVHVWAYCVIAFSALSVFFIYFFRDPDTLTDIVKRPICAGALIFAFLSALYLAPVSEEFIRFLSPSISRLREAYMTEAPGFQALSVYPRATYEYILKLISYIMLFTVISSKISRPSRNGFGGKRANTGLNANIIQLGALSALLTVLLHSICDFNLHIPANAVYFTVMTAIAAGISFSRGEKRNLGFLDSLVNCVMLTGFAIAVFSIIQFFSGNGKIYWAIEKTGSFFGPYINRDHYAGYMGMCLCLSLAYFLSELSESPFFGIRSLKRKILWLSSEEANKILIHFFFIAVMSASLFLTTSRGGILSSAGGILFFAFLMLITSEKQRRKRFVLALLLAFCFACLMVIWVGPEPTFEKFRAVINFFIREKPILNEIRPHIWKDTLAVIADYPFFGTGLGTYYYIFPQYRTFPWYHGALFHAHNDYLQILAEAGIIGLVSVIAFFTWYLRRVKECLRNLRIYSLRFGA